MKVGSLFSGIGGIELGFEREGFETIWFVEKEPFCQRVLRKHWPNTPIHGDIKEVDFTKLPKPDILTGGFPCQDISIAGRGKGIQGSRSGLWSEYFRAISEIRPKYAVIENVAAISFRGLNKVLADLAQEGYNADWLDLRARDFGAIHKRERIFIIAYTTGDRCDNRSHIWREGQILQAQKRQVEKDKQEGNRRQLWNNKSSETKLANSGEKRHVEHKPKVYSDKERQQALNEFVPGSFAHNISKRIQRFREESLQGEQGFSRFKNVGSLEDLQGRQDIPEPLIRGGRNGLPNRVDRTKAIGNAVVPQCAQFVAKLIKDKEKMQESSKIVHKNAKA